MQEEAPTVGEPAETVTERGPLRPHHGFFSPGIGFESGHVVWLFHFDENPMPVDAFSEVWLESPDGELTLYIDPAEAATYVTANHDFDAVHGADVDWRELSRDRAAVTVVGDDDTTLEVRVDFTSTVRTRLMGLVARLTPNAFLRTGVGNAIGTATFGLLMRQRGTDLVGRTETGTRYMGDPDVLAMVADASATLDGEDLGAVAAPRSERAYGDIRTATVPYGLFGRLHLEYPVPGQPASG